MRGSTLLPTDKKTNQSKPGVRDVESMQKKKTYTYTIGRLYVGKTFLLEKPSTPPYLLMSCQEVPEGRPERLTR